MSNNKYHIYKFVNENGSVLYVGKSKNIKSRVSSHIREKDWIKEGQKVYVAEVCSQTDMDIYELYYINKLNPVHNVANAYNNGFSVDIKSLDFQLYKTVKKEDLPMSITREIEVGLEKVDNDYRNHYEEIPFDFKIGMMLNKHIYKKLDTHLGDLSFISGYEFTYSDCGHESLRLSFLLSNSIEVLIVIIGTCGDLMLLRDGFYYTNLKDTLTEIYESEHYIQLKSVACQLNVRHNGLHTGISIYSGGGIY